MAPCPLGGAPPPCACVLDGLPRATNTIPDATGTNRRTRLLRHESKRSMISGLHLAGTTAVTIHPGTVLESSTSGSGPPARAIRSAAPCQFEPASRRSTTTPSPSRMPACSPRPRCSSSTSPNWTRRSPEPRNARRPSAGLSKSAPPSSGSLTGDGSRPRDRGRSAGSAMLNTTIRDSRSNRDVRPSPLRVGGDLRRLRHRLAVGVADYDARIHGRRSAVLVWPSGLGGRE